MPGTGPQCNSVFTFDIIVNRIGKVNSSRPQEMARLDEGSLVVMGGKELEVPKALRIVWGPPETMLKDS